MLITLSCSWLLSVLKTVMYLAGCLVNKIDLNAEEV
jgi:hypothetical protein